jgi:4-amino-4-deoxy-L-arabinose transferase-like glycosyltransferase
MSARTKNSRWTIHLVGLALAIAYLAVLLMTSRAIGFSRDEGFYFSAARSYQSWFDVLADDPSTAMKDATIVRYWKNNHEHPALMKTLFGFSNRIFHKKTNILSSATAFRLPGMITAALIVYLLFLWGAQVFGPRAGFVAGLSFAMMPRVFYHAHTACFDMPITAVWLLVTYLYWRSLSSWKFGLGASVAFGLALCIKLNAFFLPFVLGLHYLFVVVSRRRQNKTIPRPWAFVFGLIVSPTIFMAHWPWLWFDTLKHLENYVGFHAAHPHYNTAWFGENIVQSPTPLAFPLVMTLVTIPTITCVLSFAGGLLRLRHHLTARVVQLIPKNWLPVGPKSTDGLDSLILLCAAFPVLLISMPTVPVFGGTKHWMPAFPFFALYAGIAATRLADISASALARLPSSAVRSAIICLLLIPPLGQTIASHPFGLASYVPLFGGAPGAATSGMTTQFWGYTTGSVAPWLNEHVPDNGNVEFHDTARPSLAMFKEENILRSDIHSRGIKQSDYAILHHELHMIRNESWIWNEYGTFIPKHVLTYQGVPIISVYQNPKSAKVKERTKQNVSKKTGR